VNDHIRELADALDHARRDVRAIDPSHPSLVEIGYALKAEAQWRSLDCPPAMRGALERELLAAASALPEDADSPSLRAVSEAVRAATRADMIASPRPVS